MWFEVKDFAVDYDGAHVLRDVSIGIDRGEIVTLIGSNGAGKTTFLRAVSRLKSCRDGEVWFEDANITRASPHDIVRAGIIHVPEGRGLFPYMSVNDNLGLSSYLRKDRRAIARELETTYAHFPRLKERRSQRAGTLSGGEQQMLAIACGLLAKPKLLLLDEPSTGLSPIMVDEVARIVTSIRESGTTVLLVEQNARLALDLADRCYVLETGRIVLSGTANELRGSEEVRKAYLGG